MGARAYKKDSHVRRLVEKGGFEEKAAETSVEVHYEVVEEVAKNLASKEFVESEIRGLKEHMDTRLDAQDKLIESKFQGIRDYIDLKLAAMSKDQRLEFVFLVIAAIALMQGSNWLIGSLF